MRAAPPRTWRQQSHRGAPHRCTAACLPAAANPAPACHPACKRRPRPCLPPADVLLDLTSMQELDWRVPQVVMPAVPQMMGAPQQPAMPQQPAAMPPPQ